MNQTQITQTVTAIFQETFPELASGLLDLDKQQKDFERWDSFAHMELVSKVEQRCGVTFDLEEVIALESPRKFIEMVSKKL